MKNIIWYSIMIIFLSGCVGKVVSRTFIIENRTSHKIRIQFFQNRIFVESIEKIGQGVIWEKIGTDKHGKSVLVSQVLMGDSVVISYNDNKRQIYSLYSQSQAFSGIPINKKNIYLNEAYAAESNTLYRYTFTEEDYNNAEEF